MVSASRTHSGAWETAVSGGQRRVSITLARGSAQSIAAALTTTTDERPDDELASIVIINSIAG